MTNWKELIPWQSIGPLVFLLAAGLCCYLLLPPEHRKEAAYLIIGAALTRVKISAPNNK